MSNRIPTIWGKRGFGWAVFAGVVAHYLSLLALILLMWGIRPFVWAAVYSEPYKPSPGPVDPDTNEWLLFQSIGFLSWVAAGAAATRWSIPKSRAALLVLIVLGVTLTFVGGIAPNASALRTSIYLAEIPLGLVLGSVTYLWRARSQPVTAAQSTDVVK